DGAVLVLRADPRRSEALLRLPHLLGAGDAKAEVTERTARPRRPRHQREDDRRLLQLELGVVVVALGRRDAEEHTVELDGPAEVGHVQRQVKRHPRLGRGQRGHRHPSRRYGLRTGAGTTQARTASTAAAPANARKNGAVVPTYLRQAAS